MGKVSLQCAAALALLVGSWPSGAHAAQDITRKVVQTLTLAASGQRDEFIRALDGVEITVPLFEPSNARALFQYLSGCSVASSRQHDERDDRSVWVMTEWTCEKEDRYVDTRLQDGVIDFIRFGPPPVVVVP